MSNNILIVDDDRELCALLSDFLALVGFITHAIHDGAEAVRHCRDHLHDAIVLEVGQTTINVADRSATFGGVDLQLTSAEFNILQVLVTNAGTVVNKEVISQNALGRALLAYDRSIDVHISKIRKKLAALGGGNLIVSVRGSGYQFRIGIGDA